LQRGVIQNPPATACRALVNLARERGGPDNITVQVLRVA
jgi:serine/threonine protein phosphatase PrpC